MSNFYSQSESHLEKWRALLRASLEVCDATTSVKQPTGDRFRYWFPEYAINAYHNLITRHLPLSAHKPCLKTFDQSGQQTTTTYEEVDRLVRLLAANLNLRPCSKLAIIGGPSIETATLMLASAFLGCHHTVVIPSLPAASITARLELFEPDLVVVSPGSTLGDSIKSRPFEVATLRIANDCIWINDTLCRRDRLLSEQSAIYQAGDALFSLFTSGSTGFPKGIVHGTIGFLLYAHYTSHYFFQLGSHSTMLCGAASGWINGHTYSLYAPLLHGATTVLVEEPARLSMLQPLTDILESAQPTILYLPVTTVRILRSISAKAAPLLSASPLEAIGTMGEMLAPSTEQWFSSFFSGGHLPVINTYFQTETGGVLCAKRCQDQPGIQEGEIGPLPWFSSIQENHGILELRSSVPGFMIDVISTERDKQISKYFPADSYCLHDYGSIKEGTLFCSGRSDDIINVRGARLASGELESHILAIPGIMECAAVEFKNKLELTDMRLFMVLSDNTLLNDANFPYLLLSQATQLLKQTVSDLASPCSIVFVESLPKTLSGKILRRLLRYLELPDHPKGCVVELPEAINLKILGSV